MPGVVMQARLGPGAGVALHTGEMVSGFMRESRRIPHIVAIGWHTDAIY